MRAAFGVMAVLLAVAGCSPSRPQTQAEACAAQANDDPVVKDILMKSAGSTYLQVSLQNQLRAAKQAATIACLQGRGIVPPGGVERQKPLS